MNRLIITILHMFIFINISFSQTERILVKQFPLTSANSIVIDFTNDVEVKYIDAKYPKINIKIKSSLSSSASDALVRMGRYDFETRVDGDDFIISIPKLNKKITLGDGEEVVEKISCEIFLPHNMKLREI